MVPFRPMVATAPLALEVATLRGILHVPSSGPAVRRHLAFFLHGFEMGGAQRMTLTIAGALARAGHRVDLVVVSEAGPLGSEVPAGVKVMALRPATSWLRGVARRHGVRAAIPLLAAYIRGHAPDIIFGGANHVAIALAIAHRLARTPSTRLVLRATNPIGQRGRSRLKMWTARRLLPAADAIIAVSAPIADDHSALLGSRSRIDLIPEPALDRAFERRLAAAPFHPWLVSGAPLVVTIGRLVRQKDHSTLLDAFAQVADRQPAARLLVVGDGPLRGELDAQIRMLGLGDRVAFAGEIGNPLPALRFARCFALSSRWEGLGIVAIEAAAAGCRIVATDTPAVRWALRDGRLGRLVPPRDPAAMAQAIEAALTTDTPFAGDGAHLGAFSEPAVANRYADLVDELCADREHPGHFNTTRFKLDLPNNGGRLRCATETAW